nr:coiled coil domain-containing protein [Desulfuromonadales bacterium]NIR33237.1 coiled coil domain-containing protein [Desulfuromonadales bacterium]NIS40747.1 coiled coil domain-containing protein [Desulfuromonadales bacterium]
DTRIEIQKQIEELRKREEKARNQLEEIKQAGSEAWKDMSKSVETAVGNLKEGIEEALNRFK